MCHGHRQGTLRVIALHEIPSDCRLRESWNALVEQTENPQVFYRYEWAVAVQSAYGHSLRPLIFLFYDGDALVGIAPLATSGSADRACFLAASTADYCDVLSRPENRQHIWNCLLRELNKQNINTLVLANLPADSATAGLVRRANGFHSHIRVAYDCAGVVLGTAEERSALKCALQKKKVYRRAVRQMTAEGLEVIHLQNHSEVSRCLAQFYEAHIARFRASGRKSNLEDPARRHFLNELASELCASRLLVLSCLRVREVPIAWNYGFRFHGSWFWYQPTFAASHERFSPGFSLLGKIIEASCDDPDIARVDLGLGAEEYKERFATATRRTLYATLQRSPVHHVKTAMRHRLTSFVKQSPYVERKIRAVVNYTREPRAL